MSLPPRCNLSKAEAPALWIALALESMLLPTATLSKTTKQTALSVEIVKKHPGPVQVTRRVKVNVPGKHFPQLTAAEQAADYEGTAVEFCERHSFPRHLKARYNAKFRPNVAKQVAAVATNGSAAASGSAK